MEQQERPPLEVILLENITFLAIGHNRMWADYAIITPVYRRMGGKLGRMDTWHTGASKPSFTQFYDSSEQVEFTLRDDLHGQLKIGNTEYHVETAPTDTPIKHTKKCFSQREEADEFIKSYIQSH